MGYVVLMKSLIDSNVPTYLSLTYRNENIFYLAFKPATLTIHLSVITTEPLYLFLSLYLLTLTPFTFIFHKDQKL